MTNTPAEQWPAPHILEAPNGILLPSEALNGITVELPEELQLEPDDELAIGFGREAPFVAPGERRCHFHPSSISRWIGVDIDAFYLIFRSGEPYAASDMLQVYFEPLRVDQLPSPKVNEAVDGVIDMRTFAGDATITVPRWPFVRSGQFIWIDLRGIRPDGLPTRKNLVARDVTAGDVVERLHREVLGAFRHGSTVTVEARVSFDNNLNVAPPTYFPLARYTLITDASGTGLDRSRNWLTVIGARDLRLIRQSKAP